MKRRKIRVIITTDEGEVLDSFAVVHWRDDDPAIAEDDMESVGSRASESVLGERIAKYVISK